MRSSRTRPVLYVIACGGRPAGQLPEFVRFAQSLDWDVCVIATPDGTKFLDADQLSELTGHPVRAHFKHPDEPDVLPSPDAFVIAPATFNTVNKLALGIADTYALSSVAEVIGRGVPTVVVPAVNTALAARRPFRQSIESLRAEGVRVLFGPEDGWEPLPPGRNDPRLFPWVRALDLVEV